MIGKNSKRVNVTMSKEIYDKLKNDAEYEGKTVSNFAYKCIKEHYGINSDDE